jgi:hypothetical protein
MVRSKRLLSDGEGALVERLGVSVAALVVVEEGQVVEVGGGVGMVRSQRFFSDGEAPLQSGSAKQEAKLE